MCNILSRGCVALQLASQHLDSLAHASERETVFSTVIQAGRVGIMTNLTLLMDDIGLLQPTILSTTPR